MIYNQNYLNHIGVLGMKWGRRRSPGKIEIRKRNSTSMNTIANKTNKLIKDTGQTAGKIVSGVALGITIVSAMQGAGILAKTIHGVAKETILGRKVAYTVLDEFGKTIVKGRTGVYKGYPR